MIIDSHCHLDYEPLINDINQVLLNAKNNNISHLLTIGTGLESSKKVYEIVEKHENIYGSIGIHPNSTTNNLDDLNELLTIKKKSKKIIAFGETGLDFFRTEPALQEKQKYSFRRHIKIAKDHNKALVIHDRDSHQAVLDLLAEEGAPNNTIFHCFSGDVAMAKECIANKYYLSFAGTVTFKNAPELRQAAALVPLDQILVETDSPFLAPMPNRGSLNTPAQIPNTLRVLADVRGESVDYLAAAISENAERIFGKF